MSKVKKVKSMVAGKMQDFEKHFFLENGFSDVESTKIYQDWNTTDGLSIPHMPLIRK